jgi:hypothetical protein
MASKFSPTLLVWRELHQYIVGLLLPPKVREEEWLTRTLLLLRLHHLATTRVCAAVCGVVPRCRAYLLLFRKIVARIIFLSAISGLFGSWAVTNSDMGCVLRLTRPALYKQLRRNPNPAATQPSLCPCVAATPSPYPLRRAPDDMTVSLRNAPLVNMYG